MMRKTSYPALLVCGLLLLACNDAVEVAENTTQKLTSATAKKQSPQQQLDTSATITD